MNTLLSETRLEALEQAVERRMGLRFPRNKWPDLERGIRMAARELGFFNADACAEWFLNGQSNKETIEMLVGYLANGETYFFREQASFDALEQSVLPEILRNHGPSERSLRIWSVGCSSGEEPYSIAIMLHRMEPLLKAWNISILATDMNPRATQKAAEGVFGEWSFRSAPPWLKERYFDKIECGLYALKLEIRKTVTFDQLNLVEDLYPSPLNGTNGMDIIFCRNVLMYFTQERATQTIRQFHQCLNTGGWLVLSPCEMFNSGFQGFEYVDFPDTILYRKQAIEDSTQATNQSMLSKPRASKSKAKVLKPVMPEMPKRDLVVPDFMGIPESKVDERAALALYEQGCNSAAVDILRAILLKDPHDLPAAIKMCRICANEGHLTEALRLSEHVIGQDRLRADLHYLNAAILLELGMEVAAAASLKRALYLNQNMALSHFALGNIAMRAGKSSEAHRYFENALNSMAGLALDQTVPDSEGITVGKLTEIIRSSFKRT